MSLCLLCANAHADVTVLVGEPFGAFGTMMPVGHAAIYLDQVCADGPLKLRTCHPGEQAGVVIARYYQLGDLDWIASPVMQFLYSVDQPEQVPHFATAQQVAQLREVYRQHYLEDLVPDGQQNRKSTEEWWESTGAAYDRKIWGYTLPSTQEQDQRLIQYLNADENHHRYHLSGSNCANFAADLLNIYYPGIVRHSDLVADFGLMSPKQVLRSVSAYAARNSDLHLRVLEIPQVPGTLTRSHPVRGGAEGTLKTKRYLFPLIAIQPEIPAITALLYLDHGRWKVGKGAILTAPADFLHHEPGSVLAATQTPAGVSTPTPSIGLGSSMEDTGAEDVQER